jgi:hypothetical protein
MFIKTSQMIKNCEVFITLISNVFFAGVYGFYFYSLENIYPNKIKNSKQQSGALFSSYN